MDSQNNDNSANLWEELDAKYGSKSPHKSGKKFKLLIASAVLAAIFLSGFAYSFISSIEEMRAMALNNTEKILKDVDRNIESFNKRTAEYEANLTSMMDNCRNKGECNIEKITSESFMPFNSKIGIFGLESVKFLFEWHKEKLGNETLTNDCAGLSKPVGIILNEMLGTAEAGRGYMELSKNDNTTGKTREEIDQLKLSNSSQSAEIVKNRVSEERARFLKSYFDELKQSYKNSKEGKIKEFLKKPSKIMENAKEEFKYDASKEVFINLCMGSVNSQTISYHKEFIESAYSEFESLVNQGKYEEAIPYFYIISGFLAGFGENNNPSYIG